MSRKHVQHAVCLLAIAATIVSGCSMANIGSVVKGNFLGGGS